MPKNGIIKAVNGGKILENPELIDSTESSDTAQNTPAAGQSAGMTAAELLEAMTSADRVHMFIPGWLYFDNDEESDVFNALPEEEREAIYKRQQALVPEKTIQMWKRHDEWLKTATQEEIEAWEYNHTGCGSHEYIPENK
jgi:hypothetical protein